MNRFPIRPPAIAASRRAALIAVLSTVLAIPVAHAAGLNDTGQTDCYSSTGMAVPCAGGQDGRYGRDAAAAAGMLTKTGAGDAGFDFTKIANNGVVLPASATRGLSTNPNDWACTRDNVTGLTWEVRSVFNASLRYQGNTYTWLQSANNGGMAGSAGTDTCNGSLAAYANQCNTTNYALAVNATALCGYADWRLPSLAELRSLSHAGTLIPQIDATYFPDTQNAYYWTSSNYPTDPTGARVVTFADSASTALPKNTPSYVRLVRSGP